MTEYTRRELRKVTRQALEQLALQHRVGPLVDKCRAALADLNREGPQPDLREPYVCRTQVQPGLWLTVDASHNIVLEVRTVDEAELLAAYALSDVTGMVSQLAGCRGIRDAAEHDAERKRLGALSGAERMRRLGAPRDGEDADSRAQAAEELAEAGLDAHSAQLVLRRAYGHLEASYGPENDGPHGTVTYDREHGTYAVLLAEADKLAETGEAFDELRRLEDRLDTVCGLARQTLDKPGYFEPRPGE